MGFRTIAACIGWLSLVAGPVLVGACSSGTEKNTPQASHGGSSAGGSAAGGSTSTATCTAGLGLANARIWRLTDVQYGNAVRQLFGVITPVEIADVDEGHGEFTNFSEVSTVTSKAAFAYQEVARSVALQASTTHFAKFMPCGTDDACAQQFIRNRVARAFGRRLDDAEVTGYLDLFHKGLLESPQAGVRLMIEATLQSPSFLYRTELGTPTQGGPVGQVTLTPHEIATALSFSLTNSIPDETLWQKADSNALADPAVLSAEVDRLLDSAESKTNLTELAGFWLGVERLAGTEKDLATFPEFTPELKADLYRSAQLFVQDIVGGGTVSDLVSSKRMYLNQSLATLFNIPGVTGTELQAVDVANPERQNGILTQPGVLAAYTRPTKGDPIHRGLFVYYGLACGSPIPPPPDGALDVAATFPATATERELAGLRAANGLCNACHANFDPLGLVSERYDPIGRYVESNAQGPIDQSSVLKGFGPEVDGPVDGLAGLAQKLMIGRRLSDCAVTNLAVYTLGRDVKVDTSCALQGVKDELAKTGRLRDFYKALATSPGFVKRDVQ
jgi:hypothetical protein